jgi:hypothetical protein
VRRVDSFSASLPARTLPATPLELVDDLGHGLVIGAADGQPRQVDLAGLRVLHRHLKEHVGRLAEVDPIEPQDRVGVRERHQHLADRLGHQVRHGDPLAGLRLERLEVPQGLVHLDGDRAVHGRIAGGSPRADGDLSERGDRLLPHQRDVRHPCSLLRQRAAT